MKWVTEEWEMEVVVIVKGAIIFFLFSSLSIGYKPWKLELWLQPLNLKHINHGLRGNCAWLPITCLVAVVLGYVTGSFSLNVQHEKWNE